ncbi:MAG: hypothetical protein HYW88_02365 [Candidatus Sungbacteria bacterium]|nr:hypothetical protein [Candidatus Sungbacteria bacterium]
MALSKRQKSALNLKDLIQAALNGTPHVEKMAGIRHLAGVALGCNFPQPVRDHISEAITHLEKARDLCNQLYNE